MDIAARRVEQYRIIAETYRHHFELMTKGLGIWLIGTTTGLGFVFGTEGVESGDRVLLGVLSLASLLVTAIMFAAQRWARTTQVFLVGLAEKLELDPGPFDLGSVVGPAAVVFTAVATVGLGIAAFVA